MSSQLVNPIHQQLFHRDAQTIVCFVHHMTSLVLYPFSLHRASPSVPPRRDLMHRKVWDSYVTRCFGARVVTRPINMPRTASSLAHLHRGQEVAVATIGAVHAYAGRAVAPGHAAELDRFRGGSARLPGLDENLGYGCIK